MTGLMEYVDVFIGGPGDAKLLLEDLPDGASVYEGKPAPGDYQPVFEKLAEKYHFAYCVSTLRVSHSASDNGWSACIYKGDTKEFRFSKEYRLHPIVDRVGGGDAFTGALICGMLDGRDFRDTLEFAAAAAAIKHTIPGDCNLASREEVEKLAGGDASGRVQR